MICAIRSHSCVEFLGVLVPMDSAQQMIWIDTSGASILLPYRRMHQPRGFDVLFPDANQRIRHGHVLTILEVISSEFTRPLLGATNNSMS